MRHGMNLLHCNSHDAPPVVVFLTASSRNAVCYNSGTLLPSKNRMVQPNPLNVGLTSEVISTPSFSRRPRALRVAGRLEAMVGRHDRRSGSARAGRLRPRSAEFETLSRTRRTDGGHREQGRKPAKLNRAKRTDGATRTRSAKPATTSCAATTACDLADEN
jgi:hypothetical protein